jgi:hypothetical protein
MTVNEGAFKEYANRPKNEYLKSIKKLCPGYMRKRLYALPVQKFLEIVIMQKH